MNPGVIYEYQKSIRKNSGGKKHAVVSISLNTHRTFPENAQDEILLKNLLNQAEKRVIAEFGRRSETSLLEKIATVSSKI